MNQKANLITLMVSDNTTVSPEYLYEDDNYINKLRDLLQHDVSVEQSVNEMTVYVNNNY